MFVLTYVLVFIGLASLLTLLTYSLGATIKWQANKKNKRFFAPIPTPGTFFFSVLEGRVEEIIENVTGWTLDDQGRFTLDKNKGKDKKFLAEQLGVLWIGIFATIKIFKDWHWPEFRQVKKNENGKEVIRYEVEARTADVAEFYFQFPYSVAIEGVELEGNIQANLNAVFTVFFLNPVRAVFLNKDPVDLFIAMARAAVRSWMSGKNFNEIKSITVSSNKSADQVPEFWTMLENLNGLEFKNGDPDYETESPRGLYGKLGVAIVRVELEQLDAVGEAAAALEAQQLAELRGKAEVTAAEKTAQALIVSAQGRMDAAERDAIAQRRLLQQTAGFYASLPGGDRMFVAAQLASKDSDVTTWVEGGSDVKVTLPLPMAPPIPKEPERVIPITEAPPKKSKKA